MFGEKGFDLGNGISRSRWIVSEPMVHVTCVDALDIKAVICTGIDFQDHFVGRSFTGHSFHAYGDRTPVVQLTDQNQEGKIEIGKSPEAIGIKSDDGAKRIFLLMRCESCGKGRKSRGPSLGPSDDPDALGIYKWKFAKIGLGIEDILSPC
jgi:hypothetical protein